VLQDALNALVAAGEVLVPIQCEYYALEGVGQLLKNVQLIRSSLNAGLRLAGIVLTMYDARTKLAEEVENQVRGHFSGRVFKSVIPRSVRLAEAPSFGQPAALYDPKSKGAQAYRHLALEVLGKPNPEAATPASAPVEPANSPIAAPAPANTPADAPMDTLAKATEEFEASRTSFRTSFRPEDESESRPDDGPMPAGDPHPAPDEVPPEASTAYAHHYDGEHERGGDG